MTLAERLSEYVQACFTGLWIESHEHQDALTEIAGLCRQERWRLAIWDIAGGPADANGAADPLSAIRSLSPLSTTACTTLLAIQTMTSPFPAPFRGGS